MNKFLRFVICMSVYGSSFYADDTFALPADKMIISKNPQTVHNSIFSSVQNNSAAQSVDQSASSASGIMKKNMHEAPLFNLDDMSKGAEFSATSHDAVSNATSDVKTKEPEQVAAPKIVESGIVEQKAKIAELPMPVVHDAKNIHEPASVDKDANKKEKIVKEAGVLYQAASVVEDMQGTVAFNFEEASLVNLVSYMETIHDVKFITDDIVSTAKDAKGFAGHKITFRTNKKLTKKESWDLFLTFLHIAGLDIIPMPNEGFYRIVALAKANTETIPTFIGVDVNVLPDTDMIIRFVYFVKNVDTGRIKNVIKDMQGATGKLDIFPGLKALIFTDRANIIKTLMRIVLELDRGGLPEVLSVIKLKRAIAKDVVALYKTIKPSDANSQPETVYGPRKESSLEYFPQNVTLVNDDRTNSLIILGTEKDVKRVEDFIKQYVDVAIDRKVPPIFTYRLQYTNATDIQSILSKIVSYGGGQSDGPAKFGGVKDGMKYFQSMTISADTHSNSLIINAVPEDFEALKPLIKDLDVAQKQVGLEVLIVLVSDVDTKTLGAQISGPNGAGALATGHSSLGPTFLSGVTAQTSGIPSGTPIVTTLGTPGVTEDFSLKSSLASLLGNPALNEVGSVLVTLGKPIWAIFKVLKSMSSTHIISNPFVVVSNNQTASISSGQIRQQVSGQVVSSGSVTTKGYTPVDASLQVSITPQLTKGNIFNLAITVTNSAFADASDTSALSAGQAGSPVNSKNLTTIASIANGETLVLGGIMTEQYTSTSSGVPLLEHIPILGWFFKSKTRQVSRDHFLIFIAPRLLESNSTSKDVDVYTDYKLHQAQENIDLIDQYDWFTSRKDPVQRAFFGTDHLNNFRELASGKNFAQRMLAEERLNHQLENQIERETLNKDGRRKNQQQKKEARKAVAQEKAAKRKVALSIKKQKLQNNVKQSATSVAVPVENLKPVQDTVPLKNSISNSMQPMEVK